jgi:putative ABC transport system permease protein
MEILESLKMAFNTLTTNKLRSSLTMLGIVIGNASVIAMVGIGQGTQNLAKEQFESLGPNVLFIIPGSRKARRTTFELPKTLVLEDGEAIARQVSSVVGVAAQINSQEVVSYRNQNINSLVIGASPEFLTVRNFNLAEGRFFNSMDLKRNNRVAVVGSEIADRFFQNQSPIGKTLRVRNISFEIVGVMETKGSFLGTNQDEAVYIPLTTMANQLRGRTSPYGMEVSFISLVVANEEDVNAAKFQIENLLRLRHKITGEDDFNVETQKDFLEVTQNVTGALTILLTAIAGISLFVGGIGVMNIMLVSVTERTQEIGLRKAVGARNKDILVQFLIEAIILCSLGGITGTLIGIGSLSVITMLTPLNPNISTVAIVLSVSVSGGIGLFFGVVPAQRAAKLDPIVALRSI